MLTKADTSQCLGSHHYTEHPAQTQVVGGVSIVIEESQLTAETYCSQSDYSGYSF